MTPTGYRLIPHRRQPVSVHRRGYALITVLLFLMLATILAVTAIKQVMSRSGWRPTSAPGAWR